MSLVLWILLYGSMAQANKVSYPEQKIRAAGIESIQLTGVKGRVRFYGRTGSRYRLRVRHSRHKLANDWSLSVDRQGARLLLEVFSVAHGTQWRKHVKRELWPEFDVEVEGPAVPLFVSWREGDLTFANWAAALESAQVAGRVHVRSGQGPYRLVVGEAAVEVAGHRGTLDIQGHKGSVEIRDLKGRLDLDWAQGSVALAHSEGGGRVVGSGGRLSLWRCEGDWDLQWAEGQAQVVGGRGRGRLKASGVGTHWRVHDLAWREAEIRSQSGTVEVRPPPRGARFFLTSRLGLIDGPLSSPEVDDGQGRRVRRFSVGSMPQAEIFVQTESGPIRFRH